MAQIYLPGVGGATAYLGGATAYMVGGSHSDYDASLSSNWTELELSLAKLKLKIKV